MLGALPFALQGVLGGLLGMPDIGDDLVPSADLCFPDSGLTELSGCKTMSAITQRCKAMETDEEKLRCGCVQELLNSYEE